MPAPPQPHDHAVIIAIRRYADVAAGWVTELEGPDNDAESISDWLKAPDGGGLAADNIRIVSAQGVPDPFPDGAAVPDQQKVIAALDEIAQLPKNAYGQFAGRRLYVHVSGHGWARQPDETALVTAEATKAEPLSVLVTSWTRWMQQAAPFQEIVLWADTCATVATIEPLKRMRPCVLDYTVSQNVGQVHLFESFAAPLNYRAVEATMPDGKCHGAFTYALLEGLKRGAADPVTSDSLRDYLVNAMKDFMTDEQRRRSNVGKEPAFGRTDPITFATRPRSTFPVTLRFAPEHVGRRVFVATGRTEAPVAETVLGAADWTIRLAPGFWGVFVEGTAVSKGLEVAGGGVDGIVTVA